MIENSFDTGKENMENEKEIFLIQIPELTKEQLQSLGSIFDKLNQADDVTVDHSRFVTDAEYQKEMNEKLDNPERFQVRWRRGRQISSTAPQYPTELLNLNGNWLVADNEHTKEMVIEELQDRNIQALDIKQGGAEILDDLDEDVIEDIRFRLKNSKTRPLHQWPGSPRR